MKEIKGKKKKVDGIAVVYCRLPFFPLCFDFFSLLIFIM